MKITFNGGGGVWSGECPTHISAAGFTVVEMTYPQVGELGDAMGKAPWNKISVTGDGRVIEKWRIVGKDMFQK